MARARTWTVEITITEHEDERRAHVGAVVRRRPSEQEGAVVGDESATARALAVLAYKALDAGAGDTGQMARRPMRLLS
ncbi:dsRBD fold-containing protein [Actinoplanes auranticolor]|uniref:DUF1876 domain-containing protein n=1 Tax=Actinoplanes auranticolor TaxID=47988 RepID=A0A919VVW2_9ACTN|nr:dsRBD fold-containing protein [Actinoplanes auranticolor]GIM77727.1 hypothetical protein Aau02nite_77360 [Actinoplanes auranticolor]